MASPPWGAARGDRSSTEGETDPVIRVYVVDDHGVVRQGIRAILAVDEGIEVVGEAADAVAAVAFFVRALDLGVSTVSTHLARVREKLGVQTVGEVVVYAHRHELVESSSTCTSSSRMRRITGGFSGRS